MPSAKAVLAHVVEHGGDPVRVVDDLGLKPTHDESALAGIVDKLFADNPVQAQQLRAGKDKLVGFFVGQAMKVTGGTADPSRITQLVRERAGSDSTS